MCYPVALLFRSYVRFVTEEGPGNITAGVQQRAAHPSVRPQRGSRGSGRISQRSETVMVGPWTGDW